MGNYENDLKFELECQPMADRYYMKTIKNIERIDRIDFKKSKVNRRLQYQDVDVIVKTKTGDIKISEKFRRPFGSGLDDVFIEIFSFSCLRKSKGFIEFHCAEIIFGDLE